MNKNPKKKIGNIIKPMILVLIIIGLVILSKTFGFGQKISQLKDWITALGYLGPLIYIIIYAVSVTALIPGSAMTIIAGAIFGSTFGVIIVSVASTIGASLSFLISRYFVRESIALWLGKNKKFKKLDDLTEKHGNIIVAITRLIPLFPFTLLNYGFGLTKVSFKTYLFWSWLCMLPGTILYVVGSDTVTKIVTQGRVSWSLVIIFVIFVIIIMFLSRCAQNILKRKETK